MNQMQKDAAKKALEYCKDMDMYSDYEGMLGECAGAILPGVPFDNFTANLYATPESNKALVHQYGDDLVKMMDYAKHAMPEIEDKPLSYEEIEKIAEQYNKGVNAKYKEDLAGLEEYEQWVKWCEGCDCDKPGDISTIIYMSKKVPKPEIDFGDEYVAGLIWVSEIIQKTYGVKSYYEDLGYLHVRLPSGIYDYCRDHGISREDFNEGFVIEHKSIACDSLLEGCKSFNHDIWIPSTVKSYKNMMSGCISFNSLLRVEMSSFDPYLIAEYALTPCEVQLGEKLFLTKKLVKDVCDKFWVTPDKECRHFKRYFDINEAIDACGVISEKGRKLLASKAYADGSPKYMLFYYLDYEVNLVTETSGTPWSLEMFNFREVMKTYMYPFTNTHWDVYKAVKECTDLWTSSVFSYEENGAMKEWFDNNIDNSERRRLLNIVASRVNAIEESGIAPFGNPMGQYTIDDVEVDAFVLMQIMGIDQDYRAWFSANFPNGAASREAVLERLGNNGQ